MTSAGGAPICANLSRARRTLNDSPHRLPLSPAHSPGDGGEENAARSHEDVFNHMPVHVGQASVAAVVAEGEALVVDA